MVPNRRQLILGGVFTGALVASPALRAQTAKATRKVVVGQSVPLTGAADQIGLAYFNGAKLYFDAINAKNGAGGYRIDVKALDDGYDPAKAAGNARQLLDQGVDALFGFVGTASCDAVFAVAKPAGALFFAPFAASDALHDPALAHVFHVRPALADEAYKVTRHCATLNQDRIAVFAEDDAMGRAGLAAINQALLDLKRPPIVASALSPVNSDKVDAAVAQLPRPSFRSAFSIHRPPSSAKCGGPALVASS
jgi:branched-chain amino acid transport system substrate-binding protein